MDQNVFIELGKTYANRCRTPENADTVWKDIIRLFPPERLNTYELRPSLRLSMESGDIGLALIWIVQAALIRPLLAAFLQEESHPDTRKFIEKTSRESAVGALAASESKTRPMVVQGSEESVMLSGNKKYITGGSLSDFIFLTSRRPDDQKPSSIFLLPVRHIPSDAFEALDLGCFYTACHAGLRLEAYHPPADSRISVPPSTMRRLLRVWGIIERSMITESSAGLLIYLAEQIRKHTGETILIFSDAKSELARLTQTIGQQIQSAENGDFVQPLGAVPTQFKTAIQHLKKIYETGKTDLPEEMRYRLKDIFFFQAVL